MSIASEITRLQNAKAALKTSIEAKGVTVAAATTLDGYAALVDDIPTGGGSSVPTFGGLEIAPGPLCYIGGQYGILQDWNRSSYNSAYGNNNGSTYFSFIEMGELFEKSGFSENDGSVENLLEPFDDWRLPTKDEVYTLLYGQRDGSTFNGVNGVKYAYIKLTGVKHANSSTPIGLLLFPDGLTITGRTLSGTNNNTITEDVSEMELNTFLNQGCAFIPFSGGFKQTWSGDVLNLLTSTTHVAQTDKCYELYVTSSGSTDYDKDVFKTFHCSIRLVRSVSNS